MSLVKPVDLAALQRLLASFPVRQPSEIASVAAATE
jgi:hypothetical protein